MKSVVVTGAEGFIGKNLMVALRRRQDLSAEGFDVRSTAADLDRALSTADVVYHLAGVNRPPLPEEYDAGNAGTTTTLCDRLNALGRKPLIVFSSSTQAELDNPYGRSKLAAEEILRAWARDEGGTVALFRLPNVFGKWCRPNYNSAVATFCHNIAREIPIEVSGRAKELDLVYVGDVVEAFVGLVDTPRRAGADLYEVAPVFKATLGAIAGRLYAFRSSRRDLLVPDFSDPFVKRLYATYLSYLPEGEFEYALDRKEDARGALAELLKAPSFGQIFVSRTKPGVTRGNHYHDTKVEKFCVVEGEAVVRFRLVLGGEVTSYRIRGQDFRVVDIPPGYAHSIENVGANELVVLFWSSDVFDAAKPGTYPCGVLND